MSGYQYSVGRYQLEVGASACGGISSSETWVDVIDLLPPTVLDAIRQRVALRILDAEAKRRAAPVIQAGAPAPSNLYLMRSNGLYKIGIARSVESRRAQLSTASGYAVEVAAHWPMDSDRAREVERSIHGHFAAKRMNGEWFMLDADDVMTIAVMVANLP